VSVRPDNYLGVTRTLWSNLEGVLDTEIEKLLSAGDCYAGHSAWNYHGSVWYDPDTDTWYEQVRVYGRLVDTFTGDSATNVIAQTLARYGVI
jgi:hypothetical protein